MAEIVVPELGESVVEATVARWLKEEGEPVSVGEAVVELETDKVNLEVGAEQNGILTSIEQPEGADVEIGQVLGVIDTEAEAEEPEPESESPAEEPKPKEEAEPETEEEAEPKATPVARRMADERGLDLSQISTEERITRETVERYLAEQEEEAPKPKSKEKTGAKPKLEEEAQPAPDRPEERVRMSRRRQTIARRLLEAQRTAAMLTTFNEIDMSAVIDLRRRRREPFQERHEVKLGFMSFFVKAVVGALKQFPMLNAELDGNEIVLKHYYDIGIAIGSEEGLVVPVVRGADRLTFAEIEQAIREYAQKTNEGTLSLADLRGGTFTITNGGVFGSLLSTPILNPPQVGVLGMHKIEPRPVVIDEEVVIRPMMYVALSYDHRLVDGREAVQFLVRIKQLIEDPEILLLEG